jgi:hypothetical protein
MGGIAPPGNINHFFLPEIIVMTAGSSAGIAFLLY